MSVYKPSKFSESFLNELGILKRLTWSNDFISANHFHLSQNSVVDEDLRAPCLDALSLALSNPTRVRVANATFTLADANQEMYIRYLSQIGGNRDDFDVGSFFNLLNENDPLRRLIDIPEVKLLPRSQVSFRIPMYKFKDGISNLVYQYSLTQMLPVEAKHLANDEAEAIDGFARYHRILAGAFNISNMGLSILDTDLPVQNVAIFGFFPMIVIFAMFHVFDPDGRIGVHLDHRLSSSEEMNKMMESLRRPLCISNFEQRVHGYNARPLVSQEHDLGHIADWVTIPEEILRDLPSISLKMQRLVAKFFPQTDFTRLHEYITDGPLVNRDTFNSSSLTYETFFERMVYFFRDSDSGLERPRKLRLLRSAIETEFRDHPYAQDILKGIQKGI